ncbi:hypothetical protein [Actinophytocola sp. NPDC049390]|uniref:hypothetical protein n=1 Tax=Actinophytocola sp. NPDC049390 TaxID=3363894 RepID=UPI0037AB4781
MEAALITAAVAALGCFMNHQADRRSRREHQDENARLRLDAAMRAGALFSGTDQRPANPAAVASGLLALTRLDHADLAVALLVDLWSDTPDANRVSHETAVLVIDAALRSSSPNARLVAAELLCRNAQRLSSCHSLHWPSVIDGYWSAKFGPKTKMLLTDALLRMTVARPVTEGALRSLAVRLYGIWEGDRELQMRGCIGRLISSALPALRRLGYTDFMQGNRTVMITDLEAAAATGTHNPDGFLDRMVDERCKQLGHWAAACHRTAPEDTKLVEAV